ncbi:lytic transglycosylase domain-containing protein [Cognatishimia sp. WU-CL00825]|uniref:lytic transglycosylase domain-containing protein n=1 Tax=Cognatishimia sp. WU-CL00825 TaxID=3127658 RepID=UPI003105ABB3
MIEKFGLILVLASLFGAAGVALAESPSPFPKFQAKRLKPPQAGSTKLIQVQIDEVKKTAPSTPTPDQPNVSEVGATDGANWFWGAPLLKDASAGPFRLEQALKVLSSEVGRAAIAAPRLQQMQQLAQSVGTEVLIATVGTEVSPALALAVIYVESSGKADAISSAGAQGLMQLMPATAERFGVVDALDVSQNIKGGVAYLDFLMRHFEGDPLLVLAGYNAGENAVMKKGGVPSYPETRAYVPKVLSAYSVAKGLCITPPLLASDGCVFAALNK